MTIERVFLWFCKENDFYLTFRKIMNEISPKISEYSSRVGRLINRDATFYEFFNSLWKPSHGGYGLDSVFTRLTHMAGASYYKKGKTFEHVKKLDQLGTKWRYFLKHNLIISPDGLNVDDKISFSYINVNKKDVFTVTNIDPYLGCISLLPDKKDAPYHRNEIRFYALTMDNGGGLLAGADGGKDVMFYIRRKRKLYCGH